MRNKNIKFKKQKIVRQSKCKKTCLMCVLAMVVNKSEEYVLDWFKPKNPPISDIDAFIFLAHHGIYLANCVSFANHREDGIFIAADTEFNIQYVLNNRIAYLIVDSPDLSVTEEHHAVFWNGEFILDPCQSLPQPLGRYKVRRIYPLIFTNKLYLDKGTEISLEYYP